MDENGIQLPPEPAELQPENQPAAPVVEEKVDVAEEPVKTEEVVDSTETEDNKGASQRIKELNQRAKTAEAKAKSLADRLAEITDPANLPTQQAYVPEIQPGQEISSEQYTADVTKTAKAQVDLAIAQERAVNRINSESERVIQKYPQLNPESDQFDKELSDAVTEATESAVRLNPYSASVSKTVDMLMKPYGRSVQKEAGKVAEQVARQAGETALRPNGIKQPEKPATEKSLAELEAELGTVNT